MDAMIATVVLYFTLAASAHHPVGPLDWRTLPATSYGWAICHDDPFGFGTPDCWAWKR
jgi:hypothetical protein